MQVGYKLWLTKYCILASFSYKINGPLPVMQVYFEMLDALLAEEKIPDEYSGKTQVCLQI